MPNWTKPETLLGIEIAPARIAFTQREAKALERAAAIAVQAQELLLERYGNDAELMDLHTELGMIDAGGAYVLEGDQGP